MRTFPQPGFYLNVGPLLGGFHVVSNNPEDVYLVYVSGTTKNNAYYHPEFHGYQWNYLTWTCVPGLKEMATEWQYLGVTNPTAYPLPTVGTQINKTKKISKKAQKKSMTNKKKITTEDCKIAIAAWCKKNPGFIVSKYAQEDKAERHLAVILEKICQNPKMWIRTEKSPWNGGGFERIFNLKEDAPEIEEIVKLYPDFVYMVESTSATALENAAGVLTEVEADMD